MKSTAIVLLGGPNNDQGKLSSIARERCRRAIEEFRKRPGARIIPTGGWGPHFNTTTKPHGYYLREYLERRGIPNEAIVECVESANTIEDARLSRAVVTRYRFEELIVVTSDFHLARARFLFTREFSDVALTFSGAKTHLPDEELRKRIAHEGAALAKLKRETKLSASPSAPRRSGKAASDVHLNPVVQEDPTGCGIASVAALTGRGYADVKRAAAALGIAVDDPRLWRDPKPMRRLLAHFGIAAGKREEAFTAWGRLPSRALLAIKWHRERTGPAWHWVVFVRDVAGSCVLDPKRALHTHRRTDFGRMRPKWFIRLPAK